MFEVFAYGQAVERRYDDHYSRQDDRLQLTFISSRDVQYLQLNHSENAKLNTKYRGISSFVIETNLFI